MEKPRQRALHALMFLASALAGGVTTAQCSFTTLGVTLNSNCYSRLVRTASPLADGGVVLGGEFGPSFTCPNVPNYVVIWRNGTLTPMGSGVSKAVGFAWVETSAVMPNGDVVVGGHFTSPANNIARWDGAAWHALGSGLFGGQTPWVREMVVLPDGDLVVAGSFLQPFPRLARWDGSSWHAMGGSGLQNIGALDVAPNGDLLVAGSDASGTRVMRWDGATWSPIGAAGSVPFPLSMHATAAGDIFVGGQWTVQRWDGSTWQQVGGTFYGWVTGLDEFPNGDLLAVGEFSNPTNQVARWDGSSWLPVGTGVQPSTQSQYAFDAVWLTDGSLAVVGKFASLNGATAEGAAILSPTCAAAATSIGAGCAGSAGPIVLEATHYPMLGGTARARATGVPATALAVGVYAYSTVQVPLSSGHPAGQPGCDLLVDDEFLYDFIVGPGYVQTAVDVPNNTILLGATFYHQIIPVELDASGHIQALTSSNGLALTIGSW